MSSPLTDIISISLKLGVTYGLALPTRLQEPIMRGWPLYLSALLAAGCQTHLSLRDNTLRIGATLTDLNYRQVLDNLAMFVANPSAMPSVAVIN